MLRALVMSLVVLAASLTLASGARAERRVALVIGNSAYANATVLRNPRNDATAMAGTLKRVGFDVVLGLDLDQQNFAATIQRFARKLDGADVALFYYAGHGLQINGKNYLVSVNAKLDNEFLISSETIELDAIVRLMESKVPMDLIFLDACRNNPLAENLKRNLVAMRRGGELGRGLARIEPTGRDTLIAYAAAPGQEAADGSGRHSPFTAALLKRIPHPGVEVSVMLKAVAAEVRDETHGAQRPQQLSDMSRTFYFVGPDTNLALNAPPPAPKSEPVVPETRRAATQKSDDTMVEVAFWNAAQEANECEAIRAYMQRYPHGIFLSLAKLAERRLCVEEHDRRVTILEAVPGTPDAAAVQPRPTYRPPSPVQTARPKVSRPVQPPPAQASVAPRLPSAVNPPPRPAPAQQQALAIKPLLALTHSDDNAHSFRDCRGCPEMINLPGGKFEMGSREDRTEMPIHEVSVRAFAIGKYPVTVGQWKLCVAARACHFTPKGGDDLPVFGISWSDAQDYVKWLSRVTGSKYRLPTEAEWEYAARGGTHSKYWWGDRLTPGKTACKGCGTDYHANEPMRVGSFSANPFGLYDVNGAVSQWVSDCWHKDYHGAPHDGSSWSTRDCSQHVLRGGAWNNDTSYLRTSSRDYYDTSVRYPAHGLRVARSRGN